MLPAYRLKLYRNFKALEANDFHGIVRYYERLEEDIRTLDLEEYLDCTVAYTEALFETGDHGRHLVMCDHLLELIIMQNVETWGGEDIYAKILFRKSASLYQLREYPKAEHVLRELIKLDPTQGMHTRFLKTCLLRQKPDWLLNLRAVAIVFMLLAAIMIAVELFVIKPFFFDHYAEAQLTHNLLWACGISVLLYGECRHTWKCERHVLRFTRLMRKRKANADTSE